MRRLQGLICRVTRRPVLNGTVPYFHLISSVPLFLRCPVFFIIFALGVITYVRIKEKNTFVKGTINPSSSLWLKK